MKEAFTKIKEAIANIHRVVKTDEDLEWNRAIYKCSTIVSEVEAEYGNGWIPCEKALPEEEGWYLVYTKPDKGYKSINKAQFRKGYEWNNFTPHWQGAGGNWGNVIAWMPLPEPYKPEKGV